MASNARQSFLKEIQAGFFGDFLISKGHVSQDQLRESLTHQEKVAPHLRIGEVLVERGALKEDLLLPLLQEYRAQLRLGELLVSTGQISFIKLLDALDEQRKTGESFGKVVVKMGFCSEDRVEEALAIQKTLYVE